MESLVSLFSLAAQSFPTNIALKFNEQQMDYQTLDKISTSIAQTLSQQFMLNNKLIALYVEPSIECIVMILAILKSGAAYVPIDPKAPTERIHYILNDCQPNVIITQTQLQKNLPINLTQTILCTEELLACTNNSKLLPQVKASNLAYIIYTSGTTGKPKGVMVTHKHVTRLFTETEKWFYFNNEDVIPLFHSYAFDFSVWEIWSALLYGGTLVLPDYYVSRSLSLFRDFLKKENITVLNQTPSAFYQFIQEELKHEDHLPKLRCVVFGGEKLNFQALKPWTRKYEINKPELINMYGITEITVHATYHKISLAEITSFYESIIGEAIPDLEIHLLDEARQPVPESAQGEIYISGQGVALGYLNQPDLTNERFIDNPYGSGKLYKSGDIAKFVEGKLCYVGRSDHQVKIRGFRIELGEIENALAQAGVETFFVQAKDEQLLAYIVRPLDMDLRVIFDRLQATLPSYMLPRLIEIQEIPLTTNGKVDFVLLEQAAKHTKVKGRLAELPEEKLLANIWSEILGVESIGIDNDFFELGGDSIRIMRLLTHCQEYNKTFAIPAFYEEPTLAHLCQILQPYANTKNEMIEPFALINVAAHTKLSADAIDAYPLTSLQKGILFEEIKQPNIGIYHDVYSYRVRLSYKHHYLLEALNTLVKNHPILRSAINLTTFDFPLQLIYSEAEVKVVAKDISHLDEDEQDFIIIHHMDNRRKQDFDLDKPGLLQIMIHRLSSESFQLTLSFHHVIFDGWSLSVFITELLLAYSALLTDTTYSPPLIKTSFAAYVNTELNIQNNQEAKQFWLKQVENFNFYALPFDTFCSSLNEITLIPEQAGQKRLQHIKTLGKEQFVGEVTQEQAIIVCDIPITPATSEQLKAVAGSWHCPLYMLLLAVHLRVLNVLSGRNQVVTGISTHGRPEQQGSEHLLGLFLNILPLAYKFDKSKNWQEMVSILSTSYKELLPYRHFPMYDIQMLAGHTLFDSLFNFVDFHVFNKLTGKVEIDWEKSYYFEANDMTLLPYFSLNDKGNLLLRLYGNPHRLSAEQLQSVGVYYFNAIEALLTHTFEPVTSISLLSHTETSRLINDWACTKDSLIANSNVFELIDKQATKYLKKPAIKYGNETVTYQTLLEQVNRVAAALALQNIGEGSKISFYMNRSVNLIVATLAAMKLGAWYCPIDPNYPHKHIEFISNNFDPELIISDIGFDYTGAFNNKKIVDIDSLINSSAKYPITLCAAPNTSAPMYTVYTSGTTGNPKGVIITYGNLSNFAYALQKAVPVNSDDFTSQFFSVGFDAFQLDILTALCNGACLVISKDESNLIPEDLTVLAVTPSMLNILNPNNYSKVKILMVGGEAPTTNLIRKWQTPNRKIYNIYGPTECTILSTIRDISTVNDVILLGKPLPHYSFYVLDENEQLVPPGVPGELCISGASVGLGYINLPDLTKAKFTTNPFITNTKMYKTGDIVRWTKEGELCFIGRRDFQVKLRGYRIELEAIEQTLCRYPGIEAAIVLIKDNNLLACLQTQQSIEMDDLKLHLAEQLPYYMHPQAYFLHTRLPLTAHGKIDRASLLEASKPVKREIIQPRNFQEQTLVSVLKEVLQLEEVGIDDNFFELGLNSIQSFLFLSKAKDYQPSITIQALRSKPSVRLLLENLQDSQQSSPLVLLKQQHTTQPSEPPLVLIHPAGGSIDVFLELVKHLDKFSQVLAIQFTEECFAMSNVQELAKSYHLAIKNQLGNTPYYLAGHSFGGVLAYEIAELEDTHQIVKLILLDSTPAINNYLQKNDTLWLNGICQLITSLGFNSSVVSQWREKIALLSEDEQLAAMLQLIPNNTISYEQAIHFVRIYVHNMQAVLNYCPTKPASYLGQTILLRQEGDLFGVDTRDYDLNQFLKYPAQIKIVPGDHLSMLQQPNVSVLANMLQEITYKSLESSTVAMPELQSLY